MDGTWATFNYESLNDLIAYAYKLRSYEVSGPEWLVMNRFDIAARLPEGATKDDVPEMLQALLKDRFKLATHSEMQEQPVPALMVGKSGPKLKEAAATAGVRRERAAEAGRIEDGYSERADSLDEKRGRIDDLLHGREGKLYAEVRRRDPLDAHGGKHDHDEGFVGRRRRRWALGKDARL